MIRQIIFRTEKGKPDSLRQDTKIVFVFTPAGSRQATHPYDPIAQYTRTYSADSDDRKVYYWNPTLAFRKYCIYTPYGRRACSDHSESWEVMPGHSRTLLASSEQAIHCSPPRSFWGGNLLGESSVALMNDTGSTQELALYMRLASNSLWPIAAFHPLENGGTCVASSNLVLQVFVVDGEGTYDDNFLSLEHSTKPLFSKPISCDALPDISTWRLSQDQGGRIRLVNDQDPTLGSDEVPPNTFDEIKHQLATVLEALGTLTERLAAVEKSVSDNKAELSTVHKSFLDTRNQLEGLDRSSAEVETTSALLHESLARNENRLALVEKSLSGDGADVASGHQSLLNATTQLSAVGDAIGGTTAGAARLGGRIPAIEAKVERLTGSLGVIQEDVSAVQKSCLVMHNRLSDVDSSICAHGQLLSDLVKHRVPSEPGPTTKESGRPSTPQARSKSSDTSSQAKEPSGVQESVCALEQHVATLDRRSSAVELRGDKLARGFSQTLENLASINKYLQTNRQQVTGLESKVPVLEVKSKVLSESFAATGEQVAGLALRVRSVEVKTESLSALLAMVCERESRAPPSVRSSPVMFPSREPDTELSHTRPEASESLPWLSLPQPLDEELMELSRSNDE